MANNITLTIRVPVPYASKILAGMLADGVITGKQYHKKMAKLSEE